MVPATLFTALGEPLAEDLAAALAGALAALAGPAAGGVVRARSWWDAARAWRELAADDAWDDAEEQERQRLWMMAAELHGEDVLVARAAEVANGARAVATGAARHAGERAGVDDDALLQAAASAALLALHQAELARFAGVGDGHFFVAKERLFISGRWPLGMSARGYVVF